MSSTTRYVKTAKAISYTLKCNEKDIMMEGIYLPKYEFKWSPLVFRKATDNLEIAKDCQSPITSIMCSLDVLKLCKGTSIEELKNEVEQTLDNIIELHNKEYAIFLKSNEGGYKWTCAVDLMNAYGRHYELLLYIFENLIHIVSIMVENGIYEILAEGKESLLYYFPLNK